MNKFTSYLQSYCCDKLHIRRKPVVLNFPITDNCNSRCVMCNVWADKVSGELTAEEMGRYFSSPLFANVMHAGISGGEPTLRVDLVECVEKIVKNLPSLKTLSITTHGYHTKRWGRFLPKIIESTKESGISFSLNISLDGVGKIHDEIRGIQGAFTRATNTARLALDLGVPVQFQCTVSKPNLYNVGKVLRYSKTMGADIVFRKAVTIERLYNGAVVSDVGLNKYEDSYLADFFSSPQLIKHTKSRSRRIYYRKMVHTLENGGERNRPCNFQRQGIFLGSKGEMYNCSLSDRPMGNIKEIEPNEIYSSKGAKEVTESLISNTCKTCMHDQGGAWSPWDILSDAFLLNSRLSGLYKVLSKSSSAALNMLKAETNLSLTPYSAGSSLQSSEIAYVIGAYGGEHVGDSAILGGVCLRLIEKREVKKIYVESFRLNRTRKWVESLVIPVEITVIEYGGFLADEAFKESGLVVYGGGPLMELPYQLAKHYLTLSNARKQQKDIELVGVGIGPIKTSLSRYIVRRILHVANRISVRTPEAQVEVNKMGAAASLSGDPAFDYLELRRAQNNKNTQSVSHWVGSLKQPGVELVGINLRPLWGKYDFSESDITLEEINSSFINEICKGIIEYSKSVQHQVVFAFLPMNPDQYGFSDLDAAYELEDCLGSLVDYRILEYEPNVEELVEIMRYLDSIISMRFHGCIFALSQKVPNVLGIDYQVGKPGKVTEIMSFHGLPDKVIRVDDFNSDWLTERLRFSSEGPSNTQ